MIGREGLQRPVPPGKGRRGDAVPPAFPFGLAAHGLHEIAERAHGDRAAVTGFALAALKASRPGIWLWICERALARDQGRVTGLGAAAFGLDPARFLFVEAGSGLEALIATEEAVRSGAVSTVIAETGRADFTATRRLVLAQEASATPILLLMPHTRQGASAAHARWRVAPAPSAPNRFDPRAPGAPRWNAVLERCRTAPREAGRQFDLELDDETLCLRLVSGLADGPAAPRPLRQSGHPALRKAG